MANQNILLNLLIAPDPKNTATVQQVKASIGGIGNSFTQIKSGIGQADSAINRLAANITRLGQGFLLLQGLKPFQNIAADAAKAESLATVLHVVARNAGITNEAIDKVDVSVQKLGITAQSSRESLAQFIKAGLKVESASLLARAAQDLAVLSGGNSSDTFRDLTTAVDEMSIVMLRFRGISVTNEEAQSRYAATVGKSVASLENWEKKQALLNLVLERSTRVAGIYEAAMGDVGKQISSLERFQTDAATALGEGFKPALSNVVLELTIFLRNLKLTADGANITGDAAKDLGEIVGNIAKSIRIATESLIEHREIIWSLVKAYATYKAATMAMGAASVLKANLFGGDVQKKNKQTGVMETVKKTGIFAPVVSAYKTGDQAAAAVKYNAAVAANTQQQARVSSLLAAQRTELLAKQPIQARINALTQVNTVQARAQAAVLTSQLAILNAQTASRAANLKIATAELAMSRATLATETGRMLATGARARRAPMGVGGGKAGAMVGGIVRGFGTLINMIGTLVGGWRLFTVLGVGYWLIMEGGYKKVMSAAQKFYYFVTGQQDKLNKMKKEEEAKELKDGKLGKYKAALSEQKKAEGEAKRLEYQEAQLAEKMKSSTDPDAGNKRRAIIEEIAAAKQLAQEKEAIALEAGKDVNAKDKQQAISQANKEAYRGGIENTDIKQLESLATIRDQTGQNKAVFSGAMPVSMEASTAFSGYRQEFEAYVKDLAGADTNMSRLMMSTQHFVESLKSVEDGVVMLREFSEMSEKTSRSMTDLDSIQWGIEADAKYDPASKGKENAAYGELKKSVDEEVKMTGKSIEDVITQRKAKLQRAKDTEDVTAATSRATLKNTFGLGTKDQEARGESEKLKETDSSEEKARKDADYAKRVESLGGVEGDKGALLGAYEEAVKTGKIEPVGDNELDKIAAAKTLMKELSDQLSLVTASSKDLIMQEVGLRNMENAISGITEKTKLYSNALNKVTELLEKGEKIRRKTEGSAVFKAEGAGAESLEAERMVYNARKDHKVEMAKIDAAEAQRKNVIDVEFNQRLVGGPDQQRSRNEEAAKSDATKTEKSKDAGGETAQKRLDEAKAAFNKADKGTDAAEKKTTGFTLEKAQEEVDKVKSAEEKKAQASVVASQNTGAGILQVREAYEQKITASAIIANEERLKVSEKTFDQMTAALDKYQAGYINKMNALRDITKGMVDTTASLAKGDISAAKTQEGLKFTPDAAKMGALDAAEQQTKIGADNDKYQADVTAQQNALAQKKKMVEDSSVDQATKDKRLKNLAESDVQERLAKDKEYFNTLNASRETALQKYQEYANKAKELEKGLRDQALSYAADVRNVDRIGTSSTSQFKDKQAEAKEYIELAKKARAEGDLDKAKQMADKSYDISKGLANAPGVSITDAKKAAKAGMAESNALSMGIGQENKAKNLNAAEQQKKVYEEMTTAVNKVAESIGSLSKEAEIKLNPKWDEEAIAQLMKDLDNSVKSQETAISAILSNDSYTNIKNAIEGHFAKDPVEITATAKVAGADTPPDTQGDTSGTVTPAKVATGGLIQHKAEGGIIQGVGTGTSDSIPAMLSHGEFIVKEEATAHYGKGFLDLLNSKALRFAEGGFVSGRYVNGGTPKGAMSLEQAWQIMNNPNHPDYKMAKILVDEAKSAKDGRYDALEKNSFKVGENTVQTPLSQRQLRDQKDARRAENAAEAVPRDIKTPAQKAYDALGSEKAFSGEKPQFDYGKSTKDRKVESGKDGSTTVTTKDGGKTIYKEATYLTDAEAKAKFAAQAKESNDNADYAGSKEGIAQSIKDRAATQAEFKGYWDKQERGQFNKDNNGYLRAVVAANAGRGLLGAAEIDRAGDQVTEKQRTYDGDKLIREDNAANEVARDSKGAMSKEAYLKKRDDTAAATAASEAKAEATRVADVELERAGMKKPRMVAAGGLISNVSAYFNAGGSADEWETQTLADGQTIQVKKQAPQKPKEKSMLEKAMGFFGSDKPKATTGTPTIGNAVNAIQSRKQALADAANYASGGQVEDEWITETLADGQQIQTRKKAPQKPKEKSMLQQALGFFGSDKPTKSTAPTLGNAVNAIQSRNKALADAANYAEGGEVKKSNLAKLMEFFGVTKGKKPETDSPLVHTAGLVNNRKDQALSEMEKAGYAEGGIIKQTADYWENSNEEFNKKDPSMLAQIGRSVNPLTGLGSSIGQFSKGARERDGLDMAVGASGALPAFGAALKGGLSLAKTMAKHIPKAKTAAKYMFDPLLSTGIDTARGAANFAEGGFIQEAMNFFGVKTKEQKEKEHLKKVSTATTGIRGATGGEVSPEGFKFAEGGSPAERMAALRKAAARPIDPNGGSGDMKAYGKMIAERAAKGLGSYNNAILGVRAATGGHIQGSGDIPAWVSHGEFRVNPEAVGHYGSGVLAAINDMAFPKFSGGGQAGDSSVLGAAKGVLDKDTMAKVAEQIVNLNFGKEGTATVKGTMGSNDMEILKRVARAGIQQNQRSI